jgi:predicted nucleotidyltransferase
MGITEIKSKILPVLKKYGVKRASLFGSVARGESTKNSDIDLLVELPEGSSLFELGGLKMELEELLGLKVDILTFNSLHHLLKDKILKEQVAIA